jgi:hypothetical protein
MVKLAREGAEEAQTLRMLIVVRIHKKEGCISGEQGEQKVAVMGN